MGWVWYTLVENREGCSPDAVGSDRDELKGTVYRSSRFPGGERVCARVCKTAHLLTTSTRPPGRTKKRASKGSSECVSVRAINVKLANTSAEDGASSPVMCCSGCVLEFFYKLFPTALGLAFFFKTSHLCHRLPPLLPPSLLQAPPVLPPPHQDTAGDLSSAASRTAGRSPLRQAGRRGGDSRRRRWRS